MASKTKPRKDSRICLSKFCYEVAGLSHSWEWFEFSGEVYSISSDKVKEEITAFVKEDYACQDITCLIVEAMPGKYYILPEEDSEIAIVYDEGPTPSWINEDIEGEEIAADKIESLDEYGSASCVVDDVITKLEKNDKKTEPKQSYIYVPKVTEYNTMVKSRLLPKWLRTAVAGVYKSDGEETAVTKALDAYAPTWKKEG